MEKQVKSKQRVTDHGEVFTSSEIVNAMLDLVKQETERIDARYLEPACGTGNFLVEILRRKLSVVEKNYQRSQLEFERNLVLAVSSIYGIDILEDNVIACRQRLFEMANERYSALFKKKNQRYLPPHTRIYHAEEHHLGRRAGFEDGRTRNPSNHLCRMVFSPAQQSDQAARFCLCRVIAQR
jgi:hypothetical protein